MIPRNLPPIQPLKPPKEFQQDLVKENGRLREKLRRANKKLLELQKRMSAKNG